MQNIEEMIGQIETSFASVKENVNKVDELLADAKTCKGETTKTLIVQAMKKYMALIASSLKTSES